MTTKGMEHFSEREGNRIFLWEKYREDRERTEKVILLIHGATFAGKATFDVQVPGKPGYSLMDHLVEEGYDAWALDIEGYGRSAKPETHNSETAIAVEDTKAAVHYILQHRGTGKLDLLGFSWGTQIAGLFAARHPELVRRLILYAPISEESPWMEAQRPYLETYRRNRTRQNSVEGAKGRIARVDPPGITEEEVLEAFAQEAVKSDPYSPNGVMVDLLSRMPLLDYTKLTIPTLIVHGEHDDVSRQDDLLLRFREIPCPDKQYVVLPNLGHWAVIQKNRRLLFHTITAFLKMPRQEI